MGTAEDREVFFRTVRVSRETMERIDIFAALLQKWNPAINLVSKSSLTHLWDRHFLDSAQVFDLAKSKRGHWADLGTGGGFPGMVCAILASEIAPNLRFTLVDSDARKAEFLRTVSRETSVPVDVVSERSEATPPLNANILSARALAPLNALLTYAERHLAEGGQALLMKGAAFSEEIEEALESWTFQREEYPSNTDRAGIVLSLGDIRRV